jgi:hypothetical protein
MYSIIHSCHGVLLHCRPRAIRPIDRGLESPKLSPNKPFFFISSLPPVFYYSGRKLKHGSRILANDCDEVSNSK